MKIAYLGPEKTFTEKAAKAMFPDSATFIPLSPIRKVINAVESKEVHYGVVPIENFYNGEVRETLDSLTDCVHTKIVNEKAFEIIHCLGALKSHKEITKIMSKNQALEQCSKYLCKNYPHAITISTESTSLAAETIEREQLENSAAIASETALKNTGLEILASNICPNNKTRFVALSTSSTKSTGNDKTLLAYHPPFKNRPGTLHTNLGIFANLEINLEYLQSRPDGSGGHIFYIELKGHRDDKPVKLALDSLKYALDPKNKNPSVLKVLGSYPNTDWKNGN